MVMFLKMWLLILAIIYTRHEISKLLGYMNPCDAFWLPIKVETEPPDGNARL